GGGLSLVRRLVEAHDGSVEAHSEGAGRGSEFVARLPVLEEAPPRPAGEFLSARPGGGPLQVLVVDDSAEVVESLSLVLGSWGCDVQMAYSGAGALEAARARRPD